MQKIWHQVAGSRARKARTPQVGWRVEGNGEAAASGVLGGAGGRLHFHQGGLHPVPHESTQGHQTHQSCNGRGISRPPNERITTCTDKGAQPQDYAQVAMSLTLLKLVIPS